MNIHKKNKKALISVVSTMTVAILVLTGTFAWRTFQQAITGGRNETLEYVVMLLEEDYKPVYKNNNWIKNQVISKPVYASSKYEDDSFVKAEYDRISGLYEVDEPPVFSDTWVRIKIEEYFSHNGPEEIRTANKVDDNGKLVSSFGGTGGYFELTNSDSNVKIIKLTDWANKIATDQTYNPHGRFWILDESSGWMYWAQPVIAPTKVSISPDQETDHIIDEVKLIKQPSGTWEYKIKATLEAIDVELKGYRDEGAWNDIDKDDDLYSLFGDVVIINSINFPDDVFRTYLLTGGLDTPNQYNNYLSDYAVDKKLTAQEIEKVTNMNFIGKTMSSLKGIENFTSLNHLLAYRMPNLTSLDVSEIKSLERLEAHENDNLTNVNASGLLKLTHLHIHDSPLLTNVNVDNSTGLWLIRVHNSPLLTSLELGSKPALLDLWVYNAQLSRLDITGCTNEKFRSRITNTAYFNYNPQLKADKTTNKTLKTEVTITTNLLEWE